MYQSIIIFSFILLIGDFSHKQKYQVAPCGSSQAIVIDTQTGEAWITAEYGARKTPCLHPLEYRWKQCANLYESWYKPEETRNECNSSWLSYLKNKISKE